MKRTVAVLDVDNTIFFGIDTNQLNFTLLNSLKKKGIYDIYLFTDMNFKDYSIQERNEIITTLRNNGFTVHGVLTPSDLTWDFVPDAEAEHLNQLCFVDGSYILTGKEFEDIVLSSKDKLPTVFSGALSYHPNQIIPGKAYREAAQYHMDNAGKLSENFIYRSRFSKAFSDNLIKETNYTHTKGLMLDLFLRKMPSWVGSVVVADDNKKVIETITHFKAVDETTFVPPITIIPVTKEDLTEGYYDKKLEEHQKKVQLDLALRSELDKLETTQKRVVDDNTRKKINALIEKVKTLIGKENDVDLINVLAYTNSMLVGNGVGVEINPNQGDVKFVKIGEMDIPSYKQKANQYSGSPNNSLRALGGLMLAVAIAVTITLGVLVGVGTLGIASIPAISLMAGGASSLLGSVGSFAIGRRKGLSNSMTELADNFDKSSGLELQ